MLTTLFVLYCIIAGIYGLYRIASDDAETPYAEQLHGWQALIFWMIVGFGWPYFLTQEKRRERALLNARRRKLAQKFQEQAARQERTAAIKAKADAAEESWKYINNSIKERTHNKRIKHAAEVREWDAMEKQASEEYYRKLNYSGIREARLRARQEGRDGEANMLNRILEDKIIDHASDEYFLGTLEPDERQKVVARAQAIRRDRHDEMVRSLRGHRKYF